MKTYLRSGGIVPRILNLDTRWKTCVAFRKKPCFHGDELLVPRPKISWRTTPYWLSATAYSVYSRLHSVSGGVFKQTFMENGLNSHIINALCREP